MVRFLSFAMAALLVSCVPVRAQEPTPGEAEFFEKQVRPLLAEHCLSCHGDGAKLKGGLNLKSRAGLLTGGDSGPAAVAGKPDESLLVKAISYQLDDVRMPPKGKLGSRQIDILTQWVRMGMPWPQTIAMADAQKGFTITDDQRRFWAFQPVAKVQLPTVKNGDRPHTPIDRFILAGLEAKGMAPARQADKRTLLRRATFDLTGLPPAPSDVEAFLKDSAPDAFARVVDRLLASPHYGERWGRHWLDVVRYADSFDARGLGGKGDISEAWRYRDWVVDAFNQDIPYDQFIMQQIAGDLLADKSTGTSNEPNPAGVIATGLLAIGNWGGGDADKEKMHTDIVDDQIDVVSRSFLGLTLACARCHDHKFDPFSTHDYYGLAGIFFSSHILPSVGLRTAGPDMLRIPLLSKTALARLESEKSRALELEKQLRVLIEQQHRKWVADQAPRFARYLFAAWEFQQQKQNSPKDRVAQFASARKLDGVLLGRLLERLDGSADSYRLMSKTVRDVHGKPGIHAYRGEADCPNLVVNSTSKPVSILTFRLPPRSVSIHPGPTNGVVVGWKSPITGPVKIAGRVADADPNGGDGIAWILDHRRASGLRELTRGDIPNGGAQVLAPSGKGEKQLAVEVEAGDMLQLLVLPKASHVCDTTIVEFDITTADGSQTWSLAADVVDDLHQGNPHADRQGHAAVWHFYDMAASKRGKLPPGSDTTWLARWRDSVAGIASRDSAQMAAEEQARRFQEDLLQKPNLLWGLLGVDGDLAADALPQEYRAALGLLSQELSTLKKSTARAIPFAHGCLDGGIPGTPYAGFHDAKVHVRGSYLRLGDSVPRRFPVVLAGDKQPPITSGSGRLELARWIGSPDHPLTARVLVNRLWQFHFGEGIVRTPSNFGKLGEAPTHPELLDYLAMRFVEGGWSIKQMHREIMLSAVYQQATNPSREAQHQDPDNRQLGRMNRRRLEAEAIRDNLLAVSGRLDPALGGPATRDFASRRRSLYQMTIRSDRSGFGPLFDTPDSTAPVERRINSTVAPQALFLLNDPFVLDQTRALARRVLELAQDSRQRIEGAYLLLFGRPPSLDETTIGQAFLDNGGSGERAWEEYCQVLLCANEFIYVD
jgi:mono/diheme cytochrome c family protein